MKSYTTAKLSFSTTKTAQNTLNVPIKIDGIDGIDGISSLLKRQGDTGKESISCSSPPHAPLIKPANTVNAVNAVNTSHKIIKLDDEKFKTYLAHLLFEAEKKILYSEAATQVIRLLKYDASQGKKYELFNSVALDPSGDGSIWIDRRDKNHTAYHITKSGWAVETPPILFSSFDHQLPLAEAFHGGDPRLLLPFVNVGANKNGDLTKHRQLLLLVQSISYGIPDMSHPINAMFGCPGSHKSTAQLFIRKIFDPSTAPKQKFPKDEQSAMQILDHHYIPIFDNLYSMTQWFSDTLCGAVTGIGQECRSLYTNDGSFIRAFKRCVMINGVNLPATKGDLLRRIILHPTEPNVERRTDKELEESFDKVLPEILGGFLDVIAKTLALKASVEVPKLFSLADFTEWGCVLAVALGEKDTDFILAMEENLNSQNIADIEGNVVADAFLAYCKEKLVMLSPTEDNPTHGSPEGFFALVTTQAESRNTNTKGKKWPSTASVFSRRLNESKNAIVASGWNYEVGFDKDAKREMRIWKTADNKDASAVAKRYCSVECENFDRSSCAVQNWGSLSKQSEIPLKCSAYKAKAKKEAS